MVVRRLLALTAACAILLALFSDNVAIAQDEDAGGEDAPVEVASYGDAELVETLREYDLLDEWLAASTVSRQASLLLVTNNNAYQAQRQTFLNSLATWAKRTDAVRTDLARLDAAQANTDRLRSLVIQVRDALVTDDRLGADSETLAAIEDALNQLAAVQIPEREPEILEDPLTLAEVQLKGLRELAESELVALNGVEQAISSSGTLAFVGFEDLRVGLRDVDQLIKRGRELIRPARQESEWLVSSALKQIPNLHAARMLGTSDVGGLSVVTIDAYIRAAQRSSCSVDWALLAGIGKIESNHGRLGGASVSRSGRVSTEILGPLLDGGQTQSESEEVRQLDADQRASVDETVRAAQLAVKTAFENLPWALLRTLNPQIDVSAAADDGGNGFAVVVDSDGGRLDGNDRWDRAIGPMQFLPETWSKWATDGNGDGVSDPHNLYDAAAAASRFLCDLSASRGPSPSTFVLGYNESTSYVRDVLAAAENLRAKSLPSG